LRWSSPLLFNDPFDVPRELVSGVTPAQMMEATGKWIAHLVQFPPSDTSPFLPKLKLILDVVKKGVSPDVMVKMLAAMQDVSSLPLPTDESINAIRSMWHQWLPDLRILTLTENPAHAAMWCHYADKYKGAVLEFRCNENTDSPWFQARRVEYPEERPAVYTAEGWVEMVSLQPKFAVAKILEVATHTKSRDWSYEKEWRVVSFKRPLETGQYSDYPFHCEDLIGVYLGPLIDTEDRRTLIGCAARYPSVKVFATSLTMSRVFSFDEVGT